MKKPSTAESSAAVVAALRDKVFKEPAHILLEQVRNGTGYARRQRYADALAVSLYPSRGIWFAGVEIKVSRGDWLRENKDPTKAEIARWCDYWWIAATPDVVDVAELPTEWGLLVIEGKKVRRVREAPKRTVDPAPPAFVASVFRNAGQKWDAARMQGVREGEERARDSQAEARVSEMRERMVEAQRTASDADFKLKRLERELAQVRESVAAFERGIGCELGVALARYGDVPSDIFKLAVALQRYRSKLDSRAFREVADLVDAVQVLADAASKSA